MSIADPQSITISGSTISLPRIAVGENQSVYQSADGLQKLTLSSQYGKRIRRVHRFDHSKITPDPFVPASNTKVGTSMYLVFDTPPAGYTLADIKAIYDGWMAIFTLTSSAQITKLLGGES